MTLETFCISRIEFVTGELVGEREAGDYSFYIIKKPDGSITQIEKSAIHWRRVH